MSALPAPAAIAIGVLLAWSMVRAYRGRPPTRSDAVAAVAWLSAGVLLLVTVAFARSDTARALLSAAAVECACLAGWWLRAARDDGGGEGAGQTGSPAGDPDAPAPPDWSDFDRLRDGWSRPRDPAGVA